LAIVHAAPDAPVVVPTSEILGGTVRRHEGRYIQFLVRFDKALLPVVVSLSPSVVEGLAVQ